MEQNDIMRLVQELHDIKGYQELTWEGSYEDYLSLVQKSPDMARTAFPRIYDMILSHGSEEYTEHKKKIIRYHFFKDPFENGKDAVFGLDIPLMKLVNMFKAAARGYGPEKRVLILHGPVGSAKSTIARLLKKGLEVYSRTPEGAIYTFVWKKNGLENGHIFGSSDEIPCPMHEEPLRLIPADMRGKILQAFNDRLAEDRRIHVEGDLCPPCRFMFRALMNFYQGDWGQVMKHVRVKRLVLSEKDRVGIGTFQPKDEKNQDSTELTGDINYR
jgi:serine protein kinase